MIINISKEKIDQLVVIPRPSMVFIRKFIGEGCIGAEIGVFCGYHAFEIVNNLKLKKLYLIDPYNYSNDTPENNISTSMKEYEVAKYNLNDFKEVEFIIKPSIEAAKDFKDSSLDFVYIDAEHTYRAVKEDIEAWTPKVKEWGVVAGHDWHLAVIQEAVKNIRGKYGFYHMGDDWWFVNNDKFQHYVLG